MGSLCLVGGVTGFARTRSIPSIVAGVRYVWNLLCSVEAVCMNALELSVGLLYLWSAERIRNGTANGLEGALGMSFPSPVIGGKLN